MENTKKVAANAATAFIANGDLRLSDHFKLREFTLSGAAIRYNLDNTPTTVEVERLRALCVNVLEPLRHRLVCSVSQVVIARSGSTRLWVVL